MIRLLRHDDTVHREDDGAVRLDDLAEKFKAKFDGTEPQFPGTFRRYSRWSYIARQCPVAGWLRRVHPPHRKLKWNIFNDQKWIDPRRKNSQKGIGNPCFSLQWTQWTTVKAWKKFDATWTSQGSHHTKILGDLVKTQCIGAMCSSLRREGCSFIKHDHTQSFSTTHCFRFVLRQRYAWRLRRSYITKYISLQGCLVLYWSRIRNVDNRINLIKKQEHPQTTKAYREVMEKPAAATSTMEYQALPHSTVQQQGTNRRETVKKLIQQFENHPNNEFFLQDLNKTEEIDTFSERSTKLITDMGNTEIFVLCETSSKKQCPDCALYCEFGIVKPSGRSVKPSQRTRRALHHPERIDFRRKVSNGTGSQCFFTAVNPMNASQDLEEVQFDLDKTQNYGVQKNLDSSPKYSFLVQSEARSKKRIAVLSNSIARNRPFQHTTCDLYCESGIHEDWRGFMLQSTSVPKVTASCTHAKSATWTSGSCCSRSEKIHRPSKRTEREVQGNLSLTFRGHTSQAPRRKSVR